MYRLALKEGEVMDMAMNKGIENENINIILIYLNIFYMRYLLIRRGGGGLGFAFLASLLLERFKM